ncbi:MAG: FCD domain-containing protein [Streptosporangiales bacterium]|nr:FCD domain-containing protein [Streptosporangiales bacterium]
MATQKADVYEAIAAMIRDGVFAAGEPLRESSIAARIGVSRTPVREALRRLAAEGTVELHRNRGATLVELSPTDIEEIFILRKLIEPYASGLAADRATDDDLTRLDELVESMDAAIADHDLDLLAERNNAFHATILDAANVRLLRDALAVGTRTSLVQRTFRRYTPEQLTRSQQHHRDLATAIRAGNAPWAQATMTAHIEAAREVYAVSE